MPTVLKILTAGDGGVGKTTLLHRYVEGKFIADTQMTLGVEFMVKELLINGNDIMLQLWDFGGQEQFRHLLQRYALGARGAIIMFDLTRLNTLENIQEWVNICRKYDQSLPIIFVGSKADLEDSIMVTDEYALDIQNEYDLFDYIKVSSKSGDNVESAFQHLIQEILKQEKEKR
ncbi:MAG: GTP-binding protein [Promethearchaeota archaeon]|nr:MAG: GTP-binding protein [Candidatus Lokiarchaeota archaeon]